MWKRTKIMATVGPASWDPHVLANLIRNGVDLFRINFSHGHEEQHERMLGNIRAAESAAGRPIAVCGDLCGPKIRIGPLIDDAVQLPTGASVTIQRSVLHGTADRLSTTLPELIDAVEAGQEILLADGKIRLKVVTSEAPDHFTCEVVVGGRLTSGKGVNVPNTDLNISALTEKDLRDAAWIADRDFDYVALSFVQRASDVEQLRAHLAQSGSNAHIISKIEKPQALGQIDAIIDASDAIMVARGDLGVEMDFPTVPITQKHIAHRCERAGTPCIIATEMMESMIHASRPTRAEVSDVANAVFDRVDAVMLSAESAVGAHPVAAVAAMRETVVAADQYQDTHTATTPLVAHTMSTTGALAGALRTIMEMQPIAAIVVFTASGHTARLIAKNRPSCPILALSTDRSTLRRCCLYHGVQPHATTLPRDTIAGVQQAVQVCSELRLAQSGERIIVLAGHPIDVAGTTNGLMIMEVP